ncbi:MAG: GNAT family N-acetyltransferase [Minwuia sp.]|nr:GNAT family N-acetyltransferase [Minwuia sp.]
MADVRPITRDDEADWRRLWAQYLAFYATDLGPAITDHTWARICEPESSIRTLVVIHDGAMAGFATLVLHEGTWTRSPICYLEDLCVDEAVRGTGLGRALLDGCLALARTEGWSRFYWHTDRSNSRARALYDSYVAADDSVKYHITLIE